MATHKPIFLLIATLLTTSLVAASGLQIAGVYYDPTQAENGGEAIQLDNTGDTPVPLESTRLVTKSGAFTLPSTTVLPGSGYLIADTGWSGPNGSRDNLSWPDADLELGLSLANTEGYVEIHSISSGAGSGTGNNTTIDRLVWNSSFKAKEGKMLTPQGEATPTFRNSNYTLVSVPATITIANAPPTIANVTITDDSGLSGVQLLSYERTILVQATIEEPNEETITATVDFNGEEVEMTLVNSTVNTTNNAGQRGTYEAQLPFHGAIPGKYSLTISATDSVSTSTQTMIISVLSSSAISVADALEFAGLPGASANATTIVRNLGNSARAIEVERAPAGGSCVPSRFTLAPAEGMNVTCTVFIPHTTAGTLQDAVRFVAMPAGIAGATG